jgi:hypothetical protein
MGPPGSINVGGPPSPIGRAGRHCASRRERAGLNLVGRPDRVRLPKLPPASPFSGSLSPRRADRRCRDALPRQVVFGPQPSRRLHWSEPRPESSPATRAASFRWCHGAAITECRPSTRPEPPRRAVVPSAALGNRWSPQPRRRTPAQPSTKSLPSPGVAPPLARRHLPPAQSSRGQSAVRPGRLGRPAHSGHRLHGPPSMPTAHPPQASAHQSEAAQPVSMSAFIQLQPGCLLKF